MRRLIILLLVLSAARARADTLGSRQGQRGVIDDLEQGLFQIGVDGVLATGYQSSDAASFFRGNAIGRASVRYFIQDNLAVGAYLGGLYRKLGEVKDVGFVGGGSGRWHARLGEGLFFAPEASAGLVVGERHSPAGVGLQTTDSLMGVSLSLRLPVVFFASTRFALEAGPEALVMVGSAGSGFTSLDIALAAGVSYNF